MKILYLALILSVLFFAFPTAALADGIIIPDPPVCQFEPCPPLPFPIEQLVIRYHRVNVTIQEQIAVTKVDQVFYNPNEYPIEGIYLFPIPLDAAINAFTLWVDGKPVSGEIMDADQARQKYEEIVMSLRDPALLEYVDRGAFQARIFPIPSHGERRIELEYTQVLTAENGLVRYVYPLNTEKFSLLPLEQVSISVDVTSSLPIRAAYSPSHNVSIHRENPNRVRVGYEDQNVLPDMDFALYYSLGENEAFHLLSYRDARDAFDSDGFFLVLLAPRPDASEETLPKDIIVVLDRSGSMEGEKFTQAQEALRYILRHLNPDDRFNIIAFSTDVDTYAYKMRPVSEVREAIDWVDNLYAAGSTDINLALLEAATYADGEHPTYLIFLTDGLPTEGVIETQQILDNFDREAPANLRLFTFGVGYDVDTFLLDSLSQAHHGMTTYVLPGEALDETISAFYAKMSSPVLTDLALEFDGVKTYDIYPNPLPDLFLGSQIIAVGRYRHGGTADVTLSGKIDGQVRYFTYADQFLSENSQSANSTLEALPRLWATRKIGYLLSQIRLRGPDQETIDQIVRLSIRYGIVTPYTSYLVTEPMPLGAAEQDRIVTEQLQEFQLMATAPPSGQLAVEKAADQGQLVGAEAPAALPENASGQVKIVGSRTFVYNDEIWVDTSYDPNLMQTKKVAFLSPNYFELLKAIPDLAKAFSLGPKVIAVIDDVAYEVVTDDLQVEPFDTTSTSTPKVPSDLPVHPYPSNKETPSVGTTTGDPASPFSCLGGLLPILFLPLLVLIRFFKW